MKSSILLLAFAALVFSSCTSAYKTAQTPDDVYYSPTRPQDEYVQVDKKDDRRYRNDDEYYEDRYLRMRVQNRYQWSALDDYYYNSPYAYNYSFYGSSWRSPYNNYWCWNNYYNPYSNYYSGYHNYYPGSVIVGYPRKFTPPPSRPVAFNLNSYNNSGTVRPQGSRVSNTYVPVNNGNRYNNRNSSSNSNSFGNSLRKVFSNDNNSSSNNNSSNSNSTPSRSYNPSSSSSSSSPSRSSSSSSGSSSGGSRPAR